MTTDFRGAGPLAEPLEPRRLFAAVISGGIFDDFNADGARDASEALLWGAAPSVYLDLDNDGFRGAGEPLATEPSPGEYAFADVAPGTYTVRYNSSLSTGGAILRERAQTFPFERGDQTGHVVTVADGQTVQGGDFGSFFGNTPVTGIVYNDRNGNGNWDGADNRLARVVYFDFDDDGVLDPDEGRFRSVSQFGAPFEYFAPVIRGRTYTIRTVVPAGWAQTEPAGGAPYVVTVDPQNTLALRGLDFGTQRTGPAAVLGRHLFYFKSSFGATSIGSSTNDRAIAPDKSALLPGAAAGFANVSTYSRGINGLMVDLTDLAQSYTAEQLFQIDVGDGMPDAWTTLPTGAAQIAVRRGFGVDDADRVVVTFADRAIQNQWLRVTVLQGTTSGLAEPDVFYFGHLLGDAGGDASPLRVDALDLAAVRRAAGRAAAITDPVDFNRDGRVDALDVAAARQNMARSLAVPTTPPVVSPAAADTHGDWRVLKRRSAWARLM